MPARVSLSSPIRITSAAVGIRGEPNGGLIPTTMWAVLSAGAVAPDLFQRAYQEPPLSAVLHRFRTSGIRAI
jgi:hypothetical protein